MRVVTQNSREATVTFTKDEFRVINNALNEICNGIPVPEFSTRIGADKREVLKLLHQVADASQKMP